MILGMLPLMSSFFVVFVEVFVHDKSALILENTSYLASDIFWDTYLSRLCGDTFVYLCLDRQKSGFKFSIGMLQLEKMRKYLCSTCACTCILVQVFAHLHICPIICALGFFHF